jgi:alkylation response protein AidB-like acyl-CoA dehydrogenase
MNGPVTGTDVFIPMDMIIGGQTRLGFGWNMLMVRRGDERNRTAHHPQ